MYRQRKRDLNLKPNRQLDKRSSRGMIYENEELRMRTIAICEDVDRGQNDIKKLRKENDHLKREIWGLRDECEKLEEILKKVCISANIPEFQLDVSGQNKKSGDDEDSDDDEDDDDDASSYGGTSEDQHLKTGERQRRGSGASVLTFDSEVGSCMTQMFDDDPGGGAAGGGQETGFAVDDLESVIMNPACSTSAAAVATEVICHPQPSSPEPGPSTSFAHTCQPWSHPTAISPDLECVKEETESVLSSPMNPSPTHADHLKTDLENMVLPDPSHVMLSGDVGTHNEENTLSPIAEGRRTPVIQITPASSPASNENGSQSPTDNNFPIATMEPESVHSIGCITVVPKTFKVTSEIVVGEGNESSGNVGEEQQALKSEELPRKILKMPSTPHSSEQLPTSDQIILNQASLASGIYHPQRRSSYFPAGTTMSTGLAQTLPPNIPGIHHRSFGMLTGGYSSCCCANDDSHLIGGYQSEPSLNNTLASTKAEDVSNLFDPFQCCRFSPAAAVSPLITPMTIRSVWNTVDKNIVIGFYGISGGGSVSDSSTEPKVQEIIDELEAQFDPTLENIQGIRLIPGRIFISLKNASLVRSFLTYFKNDMILKRKNSQQRIRIHFIEGATQKLTTTLVLSGIPQELSDLTVISSLNQFGQVVAPLERRNYKGVDISERIARMHVVIGEDSLPECMNVNGYNVRIKIERSPDTTATPAVPITRPVKYGFVTPAATPEANTTSAAATGTLTNTVNAPPAPSLISTLKPHKPVTRSSSSAPRLETPAPGTLTCPLPTVEQKRQSSVCVGNIPPEQHPSKLLDKQQIPATPHKVTIAQQPQSSQQSIQAGSTQTIGAPNLQPPPKKPLARLLVSSPGSFTASPPVSPQGGENLGNSGGGGGALKAFYRNFDPRRASSTQGGASGTGTHATVTPSSSYSPRVRRKSSVQFAGNLGKGGKREPLPWCGCWGLGCGN